MHLALHDAQGHTKYEREVPFPTALIGREDSVIS